MTPLFKKLNYKGNGEVVVLNAPNSFESELRAIAEEAKIVERVDDVEKIEFVMVFVMTQSAIEDAMNEIHSRLGDDAVLWFCYPKMTSKRYRCEFNRDMGWNALGNYTLEAVRQVSIDEDWSALRFRKVDNIKIMARSENNAISAEGKKRVKKRKT